MRIRKVAIWLTLLVGPGLANGGISLELIDRGAPSNGSISATGFSAFTIRLTSDSGNIMAVDLGLQDGISGPLLQRWVSANEDGVYDTPTPGYHPQQNLSPSGLNFDSHMVEQPGVLTIRGPSETADIAAVGQQVGNLPVNSLAAGYGIGEQLMATFGVTGAYQSRTLDLAYVVIPSTGTVSVHGLASVTPGYPGIFELDSARAWNASSDTWDQNATNRNWTCWGKSAAFEPGADVQFTDAGLSRGGVVNIAAPGVTPRHLNFSHTSGSYVLGGGPVNASGSFYKRGAGEVAFNSPVAIAGSAVVFAGSVAINDTFSSIGLTMVDSTLGGSGTISGGVSLNDSTNLAPGPAHGTGALTLDRLSTKAGTIRFKLGPSASDRLVVTQPDGLSWRSSKTICVIHDEGAQTGTYTLIDYQGSPLPTLFRTLMLDRLNLGPLAATLLDNASNTSVDLKLAPAPSWLPDADGQWASDANWSGPQPNSYSAVANFGPVISAPRTIHLDKNAAVGTLRFDSPTGYMIDGESTLYVSAVGFAEHARIEVASGRHTIAANMNLDYDPIIEVISSDSELTLSGSIGSFEYGFTKLGAGTLRMTGQAGYRGRTWVGAGTLIVNGVRDERGNVEIASGAALGGSGTIEQSVKLAPTALIAPGESHHAPATLTVGGLQLNDALLQFDLTESGADRIDVTDADNLLLQGICTISINGRLSPGEFVLIDYQGTPLTDLGLLALAPWTVGDAVVPLSLVYNSTNTSIDLLIGDPTRVPEPTILFLTPLFITLRRRHAA